MVEDKPRLARLTTILTQLRSKRIVTAKGIAEKYNASIRTVYRKIKTLEQYFDKCQKKWLNTPDIHLSLGQYNFVVNQKWI